MLSKCLSSELHWLSRRAALGSSRALLSYRHDALSSTIGGCHFRVTQHTHPIVNILLDNVGAVSLEGWQLANRSGAGSLSNLSKTLSSARSGQQEAGQDRSCSTAAASEQQTIVPTDDPSELRENLGGSVSPANETDGRLDSDIKGGAKRSRPYFPYGSQFQIGDQVLSPRQVIDMLGVFMDDKRKERMAQVVAARTYGVVPVVEGLIDLGNVAAVCRSAEALGCQNVHLIERGDKKYRSSQRITAGADKWLDFETWETTEQCFAKLRERGYRIAVTHCDGGSVSTPIEDMDWSIPTAVVLGNEHAGVSPEAIAGADLNCSIPMDGFVDSFNISVAAAIIMHFARRQRGRRGDLTPEQQEVLLAEFYLRNNSTTEDVLQHLLAKSSVEQKQAIRSKL